MRWRRRGLAIVAFVARWVLRIGLPLAAVAATFALFPVDVRAAGLHFQVQGTLLHNDAISADTTFGSWVFPHVDGLPVGAHLKPVDIDLVQLAQRVNSDPAGFARQLRHDLVAALPAVAAKLAAEVVIGIVVGLLLATIVGLAVRQVRGQPRQLHLLRRRGYALLATGIVVVGLAGVGVATYDSDWTRDSRLTGTLATLQLFPGRLDAYYQRHSKAIDALNAVAAIQSQLQQRVGSNDIPATSFNIMFISDMHLASSYPLVKQYAANFGVKLIINTGDEAEFGTRPEMTKSYLDQLRAVTRTVPMIWLAGNHDSPTTVRVMQRIPGVTVVGTKTRAGGGTIAVTGGELNAFGLHIAAVPDPRVYGGTGAYGADADAAVNPLEQHTIDRVFADVAKTETFDIFATHEPVAADEALHDLAGQIRETAAGHVHHQNPEDALQSGDGPISLVEGSTGAGGLDNIATGSPPPPLEFSVESIAADCQFTKIVRFQITGSAPKSPAAIGSGSLPQVTASTHYFQQQPDLGQRTCSVEQGVSAAVPLGTPGA